MLCCADVMCSSVLCCAVSQHALPLHMCMDKSLLACRLGQNDIILAAYWLPTGALCSLFVTHLAAILRHASPLPSIGINNCCCRRRADCLSVSARPLALQLSLQGCLHQQNHENMYFVVAKLRQSNQITSDLCNAQPGCYQVLSLLWCCAFCVLCCELRACKRKQCLRPGKHPDTTGAWTLKQTESEP